MPRFDPSDELRATADRRKQPSDVAASQLRGESVQQMASRFAVMFPGLPEDTVEAVLSELFRADVKITRELLADRAIASLVEMSLADGSPQVITSFEPPSTFEPQRSIPIQPTAATTQTFYTRNVPSAPPLSALVQEVPANTTHDVAADDVEMVNMGSLRPIALSEAEGYQWEPIELQTPLAPAAADASMADFLDDALDAQLALLLALPDDALSPCIQTLASILDRIADDPGNARVRRLRLGNKSFAAKVGCHEAAVDLLRLAGFQDDPGDSEGDKGLVFCGDLSELSSFGRVRDAIHGIADDLSGTQKAVERAAPINEASTNASLAAREARRSRTAALTEERLKNPRAFRQQALDKGAGNSGTLYIAKRRAAPTEVSSQRQSRHFNLSDINRMRVNDEIAGTTNYAEEYRLARQSAPAHDYSTLVARSYDSELISRQALDGTNRYRASHGLAPCRWHEAISRIAAEHAATMASGAATFSHDGFNARVARFPANRGAGENLALSQGSADVAGTAVDGWIKSPGHEKNLRGEWNVCGIGTARSANGTFYTTQLFALCL